MQVIVRTDAVKRHQFSKEIAKPAAMKLLKDTYESENKKATDPWYRTRVDVNDARHNAATYKKQIERVCSERLSPEVKDAMWRRAKQLKDEFMVGMLSGEEIHPVKQFEVNGVMKCVVDAERMAALHSVERNTQWNKQNDAKVREFKNLMRHLCPDNPRAGDIERFRPKMKGLR